MSRYIKIALFFVVVSGSGTAYLLMSSDGLNDFNTHEYEVTLQDATGLSTRSKIFLAGVPVGKIKDIELDGNSARLRVAFLRDVEIRGDAQITRRSSSILGTSTLALDPGTEDTPIIPPGGRINAGRGSEELSALMGQVTDILNDFQKNQMSLISVSLETFNSIARKIDAQSEAELGRVSRILESAARISEGTERLLRAREKDIDASMDDIQGALENIRVITGEIRRGQGSLGQAVYDNRLYESLLSTAEKTEGAAEKLRSVMDNINLLTENIDGVVSSAGDILDRAAGLGIQVDSHARYGFSTELMRAGASLRLEPRTNDRWYRIGLSSTPEGVRSRRTKTTETTSGGSRVISTEDITETSYAFSVDAELARRFGIITVRGGLLESSAGLGLDIQPLRWLSLSGELFNFTAGAVPTLRGSLTFFPFFDPDSNKPWHWIYLQGGINDALSGRRDFFLGGGLRFSDREVRGLVGMLPGLGN